MSLLDLIPGGRLVQGLVVAAAVASVIGAVTYGVHSYNDGLRGQGRAEVQAKWDKERAEQTDLALTASELNRLREKTNQSALEKIRNELSKTKQARLAADTAYDGSLRALEAALAADRESSTDPAATSGADDPRGRIAAECAKALGVLDKTARRLVDEKAGLQAYARNVCVMPP